MQSPTIEQVVDLVATLPPDRLASVYDFALFIKSHPLMLAAADVVGETEDEIRADEAEWARQFEVSRERLRAIAREAAAEFHAGRTKPMNFTLEGRLAR